MARKNITDLRVLRAYQFAKHAKVWPYDILMLETGECMKVCYRAMERAESRGLLEYGTSLRSGWLTAEGLDLLKKGGTL